MDKQETLALYAQGPTAWNDWTKKLLAEQEDLKAHGQWATAGEAYRGEIRGNNDPTRAWFAKAIATFYADNLPHTFDDAANFSGWIFPGPVIFRDASFLVSARFNDAKFHQHAHFGGATFKRDAEFHRSNFLAGAFFDGTTFGRNARFARTEFAGHASFQDAAFTEPAWFENTSFKEPAMFERAAFKGSLIMRAVSATRLVNFSEVVFGGRVSLSESTFSNVSFVRANFKSGLWCRAQFGSADFSQAKFDGNTDFRQTQFQGRADFSAIHSQGAFSLADASFYDVPNFIQSHFVEAPRLDNLELSQHTRWIASKRDESLPARYRALKRIAIQGHDREREIDFFASEIKGARFIYDFPITWRFWSRKAWVSMARWWFGWAYQLTSDFGRSLMRPLLLWLLTIVLAAGYFLSQQRDVAARVKAAPSSRIVSQAAVIWDAWRTNQPCFAGLATRDGKPDGALTGLVEPVRIETSAATEAVHLALRNGFVVLDSGSDGAHRIYGCLYGLERYADNPVPHVPSMVSFVSASQKALSGVLIFLFSLAVRNILRMK